jgi:membrane-associated protein
MGELLDIIGSVINYILHLNEHLPEFTSNNLALTYFILFLVIFLETGLVIAPFLPGDSLLFAAGTVAAIPEIGLSLFWLWLLLVSAAILGDTVNYHIGKLFGNKLAGRIVRQKHIDRTENFFKKHGGKTIIIARFVPIVRTVAPFVAGVGRMKYAQFISYNVFGGLLWVTLFILGGFFFGREPVVQENFSLVIIAIVALSLLPAIFAWLNNRRKIMKISGWLLALLGGVGLIAAISARNSAKYKLDGLAEIVELDKGYKAVVDFLFFSAIGILIFGVVLLLFYHYKTSTRRINNH